MGDCKDKTVVLYTIGCPACNVLKHKLDEAGIVYDVIDDKEEIIKNGIESVPALKVGDTLMTSLSEANKWIKSMEVSNE